MADEAGSLSSRLHEAVWPIHRRIEALPFFGALARRALPVERYVDQLRGMAIVTAALERAVAASADPSVAAAATGLVPRLAPLLDDLAFFDRRGPLPDDPGPVSEALAFAREIVRMAAEEPVRLLGVLYVSEGTAMGNLVHLEDARACAGGADGASWYAGRGGETGPAFRAFRERLDAVCIDGGRRPRRGSPWTHRRGGRRRRRGLRAIPRRARLRHCARSGASSRRPSTSRPAPTTLPADPAVGRGAPGGPGPLPRGVPLLPRAVGRARAPLHAERRGVARRPGGARPGRVDPAGPLAGGGPRPTGDAFTPPREAARPPRGGARKGLSFRSRWSFLGEAARVLGSRREERPAGRRRDAARRRASSRRPAGGRRPSAGRRRASSSRRRRTSSPASPGPSRR